jgi:hypothetical protein
MQIQEVYNEVCQSESRNDYVAADVLEAVSNGRCPLILTERKSHVEALEKLLKDKLPNVITFVGGRSKKESQRLLESVNNIPDDQQLTIIATGKYVGEGFDVPRLDTLFLAMPIVWQGTLAQYAGRLHRLHGNKHEVQIFDYADIHVPVLDRMYAKRMKGYSSIGYKTKSDVRLPDADNIIFDDTSFLPVFTADLLSAKREAVIVSPFVTVKRTAKMLQILEMPVSSGIKVMVVTRPPDEYKEADRSRVSQIVKMLREHNITVIERPKIHQKFAVIDSRTAWYGSINMLSYGSAEESIMRLESKGISGELLRILDIIPM